MKCAEPAPLGAFSPNSERSGFSARIAASMTRYAIDDCEMLTETTGRPRCAPASPPANSLTSDMTTSGRQSAQSSSTPGSAARASMPAKTSVSAREFASSMGNPWMEAKIALRRSSGASPNGRTSKPAAATCVAMESRVAMRTSPPASRTAPANGIRGPR